MAALVRSEIGRERSLLTGLPAARKLAPKEDLHRHAYEKILLHRHRRNDKSSPLTHIDTMHEYS